MRIEACGSCDMSEQCATTKQDPSGTDDSPIRRIELRGSGGPLLGVLYFEPLRIEIKRGKRVFEVDLGKTMVEGVPTIEERFLPE